VKLLVANRSGLYLLAEALRHLGSPYAHVIGAVLASLPAPEPASMRTARRLAEQGPPVEQVGIS
jgi:nitrate reductase delta subunit